MKKIYISLVVFNLFVSPAIARMCNLPSEWEALCPILTSRVAQKKPKMKLREPDAKSLEDFLSSTKDKFPHLNSLQILLPKTTLELLMSHHQRGVTLLQAELMAEYLKQMVEECQFQNSSAFDENTSHIIGREWSEIDYSGEGMTWEKQKAYYAPYGINNFKSKDCLKKFFQVESKLPYFVKIYQPLYFHFFRSCS